MAGRPVSMGGTSTLTYWVITFAILTVASLGLFIFELTNVKALENRAVSAQKRADGYGTPPQYYADEATARKTNVFAVMSDDLRKIAGAVTGVADDVGPYIVSKAERAVKDIAERKPGTVNPTDTLLTALARLDQLHTEERDRANTATADAKSLQDEKAALTAQLDSTNKQFEQQMGALREQLKRNQDEKTTALGQKDEQLREAQAEINAQKQQLVKNEREGIAIVRDKEVEIARLQNQIDALTKQVKDLKPSSFDPAAILTKADGNILRAVPGSDVVYINLGTQDKIRVGLGFEVYSQTREVPKNLRGKASLEVVTVMEDTAECRVTRRDPSQPILQGDIIVNIAYERNRKPKFVVRGDFDLNYDGTIDFDGPTQVANLIRQWGGQVVDELNESVDFVVVGMAPNVPNIAAGQPVSDVVKDQAQQQQLKQGKFRDLVDQANKMYIPVITQNQFLFLTGYTGDSGLAQR
jgi:uncharacterized coiled-coil protein SlyX